MSKRSNSHSSIAASSRSSSIDFPSDLKHKTLGKDIDKIIKHFHKEDTATPSSSSPSSSSSNYIPNLKHWKELGSYLESLQIVQLKDSSSNTDSQNTNTSNSHNNSKNSTDSLDTDSFENSENISNNLINSKNPLSAPLVYRICNHCDRPILETALADHIKSCIDMKNSKKALAAAAAAVATASSAKDKPKNTRKRKNQDVDSKESTPVLSSPSKVSSTGASSKVSSSPTKNLTANTSKASVSAAANSTPATTPATSAAAEPASSSTATTTAGSKQPPNKKQKKMPKEKKPKKEKAKPAPKVKGPVDVEKQCGVPLPNGGFCARSLTCKTHSMGAKRAVPGRSAPYDQLLAAYQRKNQAKIAAGAAAAQQAKEDLVHGATQPLDDDEETHQVLEGVMRSAAYPLERKVFMPTNLRNSFLRMREMFAGAVLPKTTENPFGALQGRAAVMNINKSTDYYFPVRIVPKPVKPVVQNQQKPAGSPGGIQAGSPTETPTPAQLVARQQQQRQPQQTSQTALQPQPQPQSGNMNSYQVPQNQQMSPNQAQQMRLNNMTPQQRQAFLTQQQQQQMMPNTNNINNNNNNNGMYNLSAHQNSQLNNAALMSKEAVVLQAQKLKQVQQQKQMMMMNTPNMQ